MEFETVADEAGVRLDPFSERREAVGGPLSAGPSASTVRSFPVLCLTIRRDDALTGLSPCWRDGEHQRVEDALDAGDAVENLS